MISSLAAPLSATIICASHAKRARGELLLAGALAEPSDGALLVFVGNDSAAAESFARNDPYVKGGLIKNWRVRPWTVVVGNADAQSTAGGAS